MQTAAPASAPSETRRFPGGRACVRNRDARFPPATCAGRAGEGGLRSGRSCPYVAAASVIRKGGDGAGTEGRTQVSILEDRALPLSYPRVQDCSASDMPQLSLEQRLLSSMARPDDDRMREYSARRQRAVASALALQGARLNRRAVSTTKPYGS